MRNKTRIWTGMLAGGALLLSAACDKVKDTGSVTTTANGTTTTTPPSEVAEHHEAAFVRAVNAIPTQKTVQIFAGDSAAFSSVNYKTMTPFKEMPDDAFDFKVAAPGQTSETAMGDNHEKLGGGHHYTVIAFADEGSTAKANMRVLDDDLQPMTNGKARIRFINTAANAGELDLMARGAKDAIFEGVNFRNEAGWKDVDPMSGTLVVRPQHKTNVVATIANVKLEAGKSYTYIVAGSMAKLDVIKFVDDVAPAPNDAGMKMDSVHMRADTMMRK